VALLDLLLEPDVRARDDPHVDGNRAAAAQSTTTNGPRLRALWSWIARATRSFRVPVSPWMSTVNVDRATWPTCWITRWISGLRPMRSASDTPSPWRSSSSTRAQGAVLERPLDREPHQLQVERLRQVVVRAETHRLDRGRDIGVRRADHAAERPAELAPRS